MVEAHAAIGFASVLERRTAETERSSQRELRPGTYNANRGYAVAIAHELGRETIARMKAGAAAKK
jgi:hypothetical protein